jgi:hypothetical protein
MVLILPGFSYKRFQGKTMTHKAQASRDLTAEEVEAFRVVPERCMEPDGDGTAA